VYIFFRDILVFPGYVWVSIGYIQVSFDVSFDVKKKFGSTTFFWVFLTCVHLSVHRSLFGIFYFIVFFDISLASQLSFEYMYVSFEFK